MNKTVTVNIGGFSFVINEKAYSLLQRYLEKVEQKLSADSVEIMQDIESRISELLKERIEGQKEVIDESDIEYIQSVMGQPEDFADEDSEKDNDTYESYEEYSSGSQKTLFRDMDNAALGGVCSGLAKYFNIDPLLMRIIFIFFAIFLGSGILLYIILLVLIPEAKTTAQKLKMSGETVNLESIKSHFNRVGNNLNSRIKSKQFSKKVNSATSRTVETASTVARIIGKIIGVAFIIAGIVSLIFLTLYLTGTAEIIPFTSFILADSFYDFLSVIFPSPLFVNMALVSLVFVVGIPLVSIVYTGLKLVFSLNTKIPMSVKVTSGIIFGVAISCLIISFVRTGLDFSGDGASQTYIETNGTAEQLEIKVLNENDQFFKRSSVYGCCEFMVITDNKIAARNVSLYIKEGSDSTKFVIKTIAKSQGITDAKATTLANEIIYDINMTDGVLEIPSYSVFNRDSKFRAQRIKVIIEVPQGKSIKFNDDMEYISCYIDDRKQYKDRYYHEKRLNNEIWRAIDGEMECDKWD